MPDWYVRRNSAESAFPFQVRLGGCEYSLTEADFILLTQAFWHVHTNYKDEVESEGYKDIVIAKGTDKPDLRSLIGLTEIKPMRRF